MLRYVIIFLSICAMGLFVAMAAGVEWGTDAAGFLAFGTFTVGFLVVMAIADLNMFKH